MMRVPTAAQLCIAAAMVAALTSSSGQAQERAPIAIRGGTVLTMAGPPIRGGTVLIRGGKIAAVGANVSVPPGATVVDATGKYVMPGLIDAMTYFGIDAQDLAETSDPITPEIRTLAAYDPTGDGFVGGAGPIRARELLVGGVTTQYVGPGDATIVSGQGAVVKTAGSSADAIVLREPAGMEISLGGGPTKTFRPRNRTPNTHPAVVSLLRQALIRAREYDQARRAYDARPAAERAKTPEPRYEAGMDALVQVLRRRIPARVQANTVTDIRGAMRLAEEFGLDLVINGGAQAYQMKAELAAKKIPVVLGPISHPFISGEEIPDLKEYPAPDERNAGWLAAAGVPVSIASYSRGLGNLAAGIAGKWLLVDAAIAEGYGMPSDEILRAVTINPARVLGVADRVGSLEAGKDADVIVLDGPPLSMKTWVERVYVNGELVHRRVAGSG
jgi:imidazolonepropionase-like amidohydrolase